MAEAVAADAVQRSAAARRRPRTRAEGRHRRRRRGSLSQGRRAHPSAAARDPAQARRARRSRRSATDFDPHFHQAIAHEPAEGRRDGEVIEEFGRGYMLGDRLIRPAIVKVAKVSKGGGSRREQAGLLRGPRRRTRSDGPADQERVPQARAEAPSRPQSERSRGRGALQGSRRGLRDPRRPRQARRLRPLRTRRRERRRGRRRLRPDDLRRLLRHLLGTRRCLRLRRRLRRRAGGAAARSAARISATTSRSPSRNRRSAPRRRSRSRARNPARPARAPAPRRDDGRDLHSVPRHGPAPLPAGIPHRRASVLELPRHAARRSPSRARRAAARDASARSAS